MVLQKHASESGASFEQRLQVMLQRIGVTKTPPADTKMCQVGQPCSFGLCMVVIIRLGEHRFSLKIFEFTDHTWSSVDL